MNFEFIIKVTPFFISLLLGLIIIPNMRLAATEKKVFLPKNFTMEVRTNYKSTNIASGIPTYIARAILCHHPRHSLSQEDIYYSIATRQQGFPSITTSIWNQAKVPCFFSTTKELLLIPFSITRCPRPM